MKHFALTLTVLTLLLIAIPAFAQNNAEIIMLDDATPAIDVEINLPPDATGTIAIDFSQAAVTLTDANNAIVFHAADERLHGLEFNIAPNSGIHTLTVERLPNATGAYVNVVSLPEMTINGAVEFIEGDAVSLNQEIALPLDGDNPGGTATINIPAETTGVVTATFPGAYATTQFIDSNGAIIAESRGGHIDGLTFIIEGGDYGFTMLGNNLTGSVIAGVRMVSLEQDGFTVMDEPQPVVEDSPLACTATIGASSANLRSGPGTGYSLLNYGYRGETFPVGGQNTEANWIVIGTQDNNSAWVRMDMTHMQGACDSLVVFDTPLRNTTSAELVFTHEEYDDEAYEHEEHEEHEEHGDDDDHYEHDDD